jgi:hypothetical protein
MSGEQESVANAAAKKAGARERSKIGFPYMDLESAVALATAIHANVGSGECDDPQLAAWSKQSAKASTFRVQVYAARTFGLLENDGGKHKLTKLGRMIVDPNQAREGRAQAFLAVPLFKAIYEKYKGGVIPPPAALERDIVTLGVSDKQKGRARQVFEKSADESGFFEHGKDRLVMPGVPSHEPTADEGKVKNGNGGDRGGGDAGKLKLDPLLIELLRKIPAPDNGWPAPQRIRWFKTFAMNVSQIYDVDGEPVEIEIKAVGTKE